MSDIQEDLNLKELEDQTKKGVKALEDFGRPVRDVAFGMLTGGASTTVTAERRKKRAQKGFDIETRKLQKERQAAIDTENKLRSKRIRESFTGSLMGDRSLKSPSDRQLLTKLGGQS